MTGAPKSRDSWWWASTGRTTMSGSPSSAPPSSTSRASTSARSDRRLTLEGPLVGGGAAGLQVGDDVAAAEGVDRLLGVADQHHRGVAGEGAVEHLPLHRVGVLELVDQHEAPALAHPRAGRGVVVEQRVGEPG